jgi:hypothetical protein
MMDGELARGHGGDGWDDDTCPRVFESTDGEHGVVLQGYEDVEPMPISGSSWPGTRRARLSGTRR